MECKDSTVWQWDEYLLAAHHHAAEGWKDLLLL